MKVGDRVHIKSTCVKYRKYDIRGTAGLIEAIRDDYSCSFGVRIDGKTNDASATGLFWIDGESLSVINCAIPKTRGLIKNVIFNNPATIVLWEDGSKTVVKCGEGELYDPEKGLAMAFSKKLLGNQGNYYETFKKWLPEYEASSSEGLSINEALQKFKKSVDTYRNLCTSFVRIPNKRSVSESSPIFKDQVELNLANGSEYENVMIKMSEIIKTYGHATYADLKDILGFTISFRDSKVGWRNLDDVSKYNGDACVTAILPPFNWEEPKEDET